MQRGGADEDKETAPGEIDDELEAWSLEDLKSRRRRNVAPTASRTSDVLPLATIEPGLFERVVAEVVAAQDNHSVHFYGRSGQAQYGLDIVEERSDGTRVLYQVKRFEKMTTSALRDAVLAYAGPPRSPPGPHPERRFHPDVFTIATSAKVEDDTALIDCISDLQDEYRGDLTVDAWGAETVSRKLRTQRGLIASVLSDEWAEIWCGADKDKSAEKREKRKRYVDEVLRAAMSVQFGKDNDVRFRQVDLTGISVESLFVDVPASSHPGSPAEHLIDEMNPHQQGEPEVGDILVPRAGAAQALLHPSWTDSTVIVGGPGQGKTTLLQFLCQYHRARCLGRDEYSPIAAGLAPVTRVDRTPIKVELTDFAAWRRKAVDDAASAKAGGEGPDLALLSYIAETIATDSGRSFTQEDLALAIATRPMIIALDGLDEIANTNERTSIADEVRTTNGRIQAITRGVMVLVATRPGNVGNPIWRDINFSALFLGDLTPALRMKYLDRWTAQSKLTTTEVDDLRSTFVESIAYPHVVELAGNPMQLAILLNLMQRRAILPEKRTALYDRYIEVFMDRESKSGLVAAHKDVIVSFHKLLGWHIHTRIETGKSNGTIGLTELRQLLVNYLTPRGYETTFVDELFDSVTTRVLCLVQRELDSQEFQFEVQPLREYFAAEHLYDVSPNNSASNNRQACLGELIRRPYWTNVMRFFAGKFSSGEVPAIPYALRALQADKAIQNHPVTRIAAKHLLDDRVLGGQLELVVTDMVRVLLDGPGPVFAVDGLFQQDESMIRFQERGGLKQAIEILIERLEAEKDHVVREAVVRILIHLGAGRVAADSWWKHTGVDPNTWVLVATRLGALQDASAAQLQLLATVTENLVANAAILPALIDASVDVLDDGLVTACLRQISTGATSLEHVRAGGPYGRLAAAANTERFYEHRTAEVQPWPQSKRHRGRVRSASPVWNTAVQTLERAHAGTGWEKAPAWHEALDAVDNVLGGDCWAVREAILAAPVFALATGSAVPSLAEGATWRDIASWCAEAVKHRSDSDWFIGEGAKCSDALSRMSFVVFALTAAKPSTLPSVLGAIDDTLRPLDPANWAAVSAALQRYASHSVAPGEINMTEALRLQKVKPSTRLAVLLWPLSNEATRVRLAKSIAPELETLWSGGFGVTSVVLHFLELWDKKIPAEKFEGSRSDVPAGTLRSERVAQVAYPVAEQILSRPQDWPADLVRAAADRLSGRLADQTPVVEVAHAADWGT